MRSIFAAWERGDFSSTEWAHPQIEFVIADDWGPAAGAWTESANLFHIRGGRVTKLVLYFDRERALTELGLDASG